MVGLEGLTDESTTITDLLMGPGGRREVLDGRVLGAVPLKQIRAASELLTVFADAFSSLKAFSGLSGSLV